MVFPVVVYGCESWTIKKSEYWRTDAFELWCWRRLLRVPWTARRSNQSILKEISPEYLLEGLMLKLQYFGHLIWRTNSFEKTLMLGKIEGSRRRGRQRMRLLDGITDSMDEFEQAPGVGDGQGSLACYSPWGHKELDTTECLNWFELMGPVVIILVFSNVKSPFYLPLSPWSRGSLVSLLFLPLECYHLHIWGCWYFSQILIPVYDLSSWHFLWYTLHVS